ncbi:hypothetical protein GGQ65_007017 [Rhizobium fabae]|uniref:Uncharacterized protein n=1 Tax=Rhizobium fabae TaxID=573179 RepID=A0A7W6FMW1_9HYPH|nr:hypothetical protein [Rhizobium fabae]
MVDCGLAPSVKTKDWLRGDLFSTFQRGNMHVPGFFPHSARIPALARLEQVPEKDGTWVGGLSALQQMRKLRRPRLV